MTIPQIVLIIVPLGIGTIVFLVAWMNAQELTTGFKRFERSYLERMHLALDALFSKASPRRIFYLHIAVTTFLFVMVSSAIGVFNGMLFAILAGVLPWSMLSRAQRKRRARIEELLPDGLLNLANSVRAGLTLPQAFQILVDNMGPPINQEFELMLKEHRMGLTLDEAMGNMAERVKSRNLDLVVTSIQVARVSGGNLAQVFEDTAEAIREITRLEAKIDTMTAQGKMQAFVLGGLPVFLGGAIYKIDPTMIAPLWEDPIGWIILFFIALLEIVGVFMIRKIVTVDV